MTDHRDEAERLVEGARADFRSAPQPEENSKAYLAAYERANIALQAAQVHALLNIGDQLTALVQAVWPERVEVVG